MHEIKTIELSQEHQGPYSRKIVSVLAKAGHYSVYKAHPHTDLEVITTMNDVPRKESRSKGKITPPIHNIDLSS